MLYYMKHFQFFLSSPGWKNSYKTTKSTQTQDHSFQELIMKRSKRSGPWDFKSEKPCRYEGRLEKKQEKKGDLKLLRGGEKKTTKPSKGYVFCFRNRKVEEKLLDEVYCKVRVNIFGSKNPEIAYSPRVYPGWKNMWLKFGDVCV